MTAGRLLRFVAVVWRLHLSMMHRSAFDGVMQVVWPLFFATAALLVYRVDGRGDALLYPALGASVMTIWTAISSSASGILQRERAFGTLELLVASPVPFSLSIMSIVLAVATIGGYGMLACLLWSRLAFGVPLPLQHPVGFLAAVVATVVSFAVLGFILAVVVVRYREAWALAGAVEYPVWLVGGFLIPADVLPAWLRPLSWALPPSWGMAAIRKAAAGEPIWTELLTCAGVTAAYGVLGVWLAGTILTSARRHATLSLS